MPATRALNLPFSDAVRVGELLFLSGQLGNLPGEPRLAPGGVTAETRQAMENIRAVLAQYDLGMDSLVKCTVFLADMADWSDFNAVYVEYFTGPLPARSALGVNGLALGARVELECVAYAGRVKESS
ncbi:MAG: Rid family detoxifying hydrolase [Pseudomonadota bacterium]